MFGRQTKRSRFTHLLAGVVLVTGGCPAGTNEVTFTNSEAKVIPAAICGSQVFQLRAGQTIDVGSLEVGNDTDNLYIQFATTGNWVIKKVHVHVDSSASDTDANPANGIEDGVDDVPVSGGGAPQPGQMEYTDGDTVLPVPLAPNPAIDDPLTAAVEVTNLYTMTIPFSQESLASGDCGNSLLVYAHAEVVQVDGDGNQYGGETAFGGDTTGGGTNRWFYLAEYTTICCEDPDDPDDPGCEGALRTQTQGGWGTECHGENPGCYRDGHFADAFPDGVTVGCTSGFTNTFTSSQAVEAYLPSGKTPKALTSNHVDPLTTEAGVLGGQTLALALSIGFDNADPDFGASDSPLADQLVQGTLTPADGLTLGALLDEANSILGGCGGSLGMNAGAINSVLNLVNQNFVDGDTDLGYVSCPE